MIEKETPSRLEHILTNQSGVSDLDIGNQIVELLQNTSLKLQEITNRGYRQIEQSGYEMYNRGHALRHWWEMRRMAMKALKSYIGFFGNKRFEWKIG